MAKKAVVELVKSFEKNRPQKKIDVDFNTFCIGFESSDVQMTTKDGKVNVTAHIGKDYFDKIIYSNGAYIIEYLKEKGLIK